MTFCYPHNQCLVQPSSEKLTCSKWEKRYRDVHLDNVQRIKDLQTSNPKWDVSIKPFPSGLRECCGREGGRMLERVGMDAIKETRPSRHSRTDTYIISQRLALLCAFQMVAKP